MKKLMFIYPDNEDLEKSLKLEQNLAYSESMSAFICFEDVYNALDSKYKFEEKAYCCVESLMDALESNWCGEAEIKITSGYGNHPSIEHDLGGNVEIALAPFEDETYPDGSKYIDELFVADDWYKYIYKYARITMLELILDSMKLDVEQQIRNIEAE